MKRAFYDKYGEEKLKEGFYSDGSNNSNFQEVLLFKNLAEAIISMGTQRKYLKSSLRRRILMLVCMTQKEEKTLEASWVIHLVDNST